MDWSWIVPLVSLTMMEIVLGIDNIVFIAVLASKLPKSQQARARKLGLGVALVTRLALLFTLSWMLQLDSPLFSLTGIGPLAQLFSADALEFSARDLILLGGGLFLIAKATYEIHDKLEGPGEKPATGGVQQFGLVLFQIAMLDIVFSLDSVITAVGMAKQIWVMVVAMILAVGVMLVFAGPLSNFVERHPTLKMLALSFLILIGVMLVAEGIGQHIDRGYIYFAMGFSLVVELLNLRLRAHGKPVVLNEPHTPVEA